MLSETVMDKRLAQHKTDRFKVSAHRLLCRLIE
jgi:hypothetical protein